MRMTFALAGTLAALVAAGAVQAQDFKPRIVRFGYGLVDESNQGRAVRFFAQEVEKATGGKMKIRAIGNASLGSDTQMQQALIGGAQEMMVGSTATLVGIAPQMALWDTPFLVSSAKEADALLDGPVGEKVKATLTPKGMVGLAYWENGFRNLTNNKHPVAKLEDMNGIKLRVMQNNVFLDSFKALGANAVPLPFSELFTALETKAVDGQENPFNTVLSSKFYEVQKYLTVTNHVYSPWIVTVSKKWWDQLTPAEQKCCRTRPTRAAISSARTPAPRPPRRWPTSSKKAWRSTSWHPPRWRACATNSRRCMPRWPPAWGRMCGSRRKTNWRASARPSKVCQRTRLTGVPDRRTRPAYHRPTHCPGGSRPPRSNPAARAGVPPVCFCQEGFPHELAPHRGRRHPAHP